MSICEWSLDDRKYMELALDLALSAQGRTSPNPMVGAVLVRGGQVVGTGYHKYAGGSHAEIYALQEAGERAKGSTLYVNLEPCSHFGNTPPCADALIEAGVRRVIIGMEDPNPKVSRGGIARLRKAGIEVLIGLCQNKAERLNEVFIKYITSGLPFIVVKCAMSLDGKIATKKGSSKWITGGEARAFAHHLRDIHDGVMVGIGTVLQDDPQLTTRLKGAKGKNPLRIVVDSKLRIPITAKVLTQTSLAPTLIVTTPQGPMEKIERVKETGAKVLVMQEASSRVDLKALISELSKFGVASLLIEGGGELNASALAAGIVDKVYAFVAPKIIGGREGVTWVEGEGANDVHQAIPLHFSDIKRLGKDILIESYVSNC